MMRQQQLELQFLEQQHLKKLMELQRERFMLKCDNPFKNETQRDVSMTLPYQSNPHIQKLLYSTTKKKEKQRKHMYIPREIDGKIAERSIQTILSNWHNQTKYFPDSAYLRNIKRQQEQVVFQSQLSDIGRQEIDEILQQSRELRQIKGKSIIRQRYESRMSRQQEYVKERLHQ